MPKGISKNGINKGWYKKGHRNIDEIEKRRLESIKKIVKSSKEIERVRQMGLNSKGRKRPDAKPPHFYGNKSSNWKGDKIQYYGLHSWIRKTFGNACRCENTNCIYPKKTKHGILLKPKRYEWALKTNKKYTRNKEDYLQLCTSCHRLYDYGKLII